MGAVGVLSSFKAVYDALQKAPEAAGLFEKLADVGDDSQLLCAEASAGNVAEVEHLLSLGADPNQGDYDYRTALHLAAAMGHSGVVKVLLRHPAIQVDKADRWCSTALDDAVSHGQTEVEALLVEAAG